MDAWIKQSLASEMERLQGQRETSERAQLIARMLLGGNDAARTQAIEAIERGCYAEEALWAIIDLPNRKDLSSNALARAMWEIARSWKR
jgi:hypothetical protein